MVDERSEDEDCKERKKEREGREWGRKKRRKEVCERAGGESKETGARLWVGEGKAGKKIYIGTWRKKDTNKKRRDAVAVAVDDPGTCEKGSWECSMRIQSGKNEEMRGWGWCQVGRRGG